MIDGAAAVLPEHAARVRIVDHHDAAGFLGELAEARQRTEVAVHAEDAVRDEQLALPGRQILEDLARRVHVLVGEHLDRRAAETAAVDDARVIQLVRDDDVLFAENRRDGARVRRESALEHDDLLDLLELGELLLQLHVDVHGAGDRPHRAGADAVVLDRLQRRGAQFRMSRQAQIVVRRKVHDRPVVDSCVCFLFILENAQIPVELLFLQRVEFLSEVGERVMAHSSAV